MQTAGIKTEAAGAQGHLFAGFLPADVKHLVGERQVGQSLQEQRALADAGVTADQHDRAIDQPATQRPIEFTDAGGDAVDFAGFDFRQVLQSGGGRQRLEATIGRCLFGNRFDQRVPLVAARALALPLRTSRAAFRAAVDGFDFGHYFRSTAAVSSRITGTRGARAQKSS